MEHVLSDAFFQSISSNWLLGLIVALSIVALGKGADWLVDAAAELAKELGVSKLIIGATIVSLGTTAPEAAVSVLAAFQGKPGLALGNGIGSVICDSALIFGVACLMARIPLDKSIMNRQGWIQLGSGILLVILAFASRIFYPEAVITRTMGVGLMILLVLYIYKSISWARAAGSERESDTKISTQQALACVGMLALGLSLVIISSQFLIGSVSELALRWSVPKAIVAATLVAFGTSLPELVTAVTSIKKGHPELVLGNIIGADILNILFVIGASSLAAPLPIPDIFFSLHFPVMIAVLILLRCYFSFAKGATSRWMGFPLLAFYIAYVVLQYIY